MNDQAPSPAASPEKENSHLARHVIQFRCKSADEKKQIIANAEEAGADLSEYCRSRTLGRRPKPKNRAAGHRLDVLQIMGELNKIGGNVNQIAKRLNMGGHVGQATTDQAMQAIIACADALRQQIDNLGHDR